MKRYLLVATVMILVVGSNIPFSAVATSSVLQCYQCNILAEVEILGGTGGGGSLLIQSLAIRLLQDFQPGTTITLLLHVFYLDGTPVQLSPETASFAFYSGRTQSILLNLENVGVVPVPDRPGYYTYSFTIPEDWPVGGVLVYVLALSCTDGYSNFNLDDSNKAFMTLSVIAAKAGFNIASYIVPAIILILLFLAVLLLALRSRKKKTNNTK